MKIIPTLQSNLVNLLNLFYPNHCLICNKIIIENSTFCPDHLKKLKFISNPRCQICSKPLKTDQEKCQKCLEKLPNYDSSTIIFIYEKTISNMILSFKYNDNTYICKKLGKIFASKINEHPIKFNIVTGVPLHKKRLRSRKYNQSIILAKHVANNLRNTKLIPDLLIRTNFNKSQAHLNEEQRMENLKNAFDINPKYKNLVQGKNILIIDDVITTGATLENCCLVLKENNASHIQIAAIAKAGQA